MADNGKNVFIPDYNEGTIRTQDINYPKSEIWEYFYSFEEAKEDLIYYLENLIADSKAKLKKAKKLKP